MKLNQIFAFNWITITVIVILTIGLIFYFVWQPEEFMGVPTMTVIKIVGGYVLIFTLLIQFNLFQNQQTETILFELIKNSRNNITDLKIENRFDKTAPRQIEGRDVFTYIFEQYCILFDSINKYVLAKAKENNDKVRKYVIDNQVFEYVQLGPKPCYKWIDNAVGNIQFEKGIKDSNPPKYHCLKHLLLINDITYSILFWGIKNGCTMDLMDHLGLYEDFDIENTLIENLKNIPPPTSPEDWRAHLGQIILNGNPNNTQPSIPLFEGQRARIGNYFRHLFEIISYIDRTGHSLKRKKHYAKIIQSQITDYQQALLFVDSISRLGLGWELNNRQGEKFMTKYELIKNVSRHFVPFLNPNDFYPGIKFQSEELRLLNSN